MSQNLIDAISAIISIFMLLIIIRIVLSWLLPASNQKGALAKLCDPYLNLFKKPIFSIGYIDFSPIVALATLVIVGDIVRQIGMAGTITFGIIVAICIRAMWGALSSLMFFLFIIILIRFIIALVKPNAHAPVLTAIDSLLGPLSLRISSIFTRNSSYSANLMLSGIAIVILYFAGNFLVSFLVALAIQI
ncbi:MAG: YggT family protein [Spirochaetaceae bacterium]|nr:YggT family protein [Spirochaetaceae bacterium]